MVFLSFLLSLFSPFLPFLLPAASSLPTLAFNLETPYFISLLKVLGTSPSSVPACGEENCVGVFVADLVGFVTLLAPIAVSVKTASVTRGHRLFLILKSVSSLFG